MPILDYKLTFGNIIMLRKILPNRNIFSAFLFYSLPAYYNFKAGKLKFPLWPLHLLKNNYQLCSTSGRQDERLTLNLNITVHMSRWNSVVAHPVNTMSFLSDRSIELSTHRTNRNEPGPFVPKQTIDCVIKVGCDYWLLPNWIENNSEHWWTLETNGNYLASFDATDW